MLWVVEPRRLWGDFGRILISGMTHQGVQDGSPRTFWGNFGRKMMSGISRQDTQGGPLLWKRTGPFLPPISMPFGGDSSTGVVVSDELRHNLKTAGLGNLRFGPVVASHVVRLDWHLWDLSANEPAEYPEGGEPENYVLDQPHSHKAAASLPVAWELLSPVFPLRLTRLEAPEGGYLDRFQVGEAVGGCPGLFLNRATYGYLVLDDGGRECLTKHAGEWVRFCEVDPPNTDRNGGTA